MSSPNLDLVRSIYADWERGDFSRADWAHPQIEYVFVDGPHPGTWIGVAEMATAQRDFLLAWEDWRIEAEECRALDDERVLVHTRMSGRGRTSGVQLAGMQQQNANVFNVRSGKVVRLVLYWDRERAFADVGLARGRSSPHVQPTPRVFLAHRAAELRSGGSLIVTGGAAADDGTSGAGVS